MTRILLALVFSMFALPVAAQPMTTHSAGMIGAFQGTTIVGALTLTPDTPGDELLYQVDPWPSVVFVAVVHATRSGPSGAYDTPGLCFEGAVSFDWSPDRLTIMDVDGDGLSDVVGQWTVNGATVHQVLTGKPLTHCAPGPRVPAPIPPGTPRFPGGVQ